MSESEPLSPRKVAAALGVSARTVDRYAKKGLLRLAFFTPGGICMIGLMFKNKEGNDVLLRTTENLQGAIIQREVCTLNAFNDIRMCTDWQTNVSRRSMKNMKGDWVGIDD